MNTLTWFLYLTSFPDKLSAICYLGFMLAFAGGAMLVVSFMIRADNSATQSEKEVSKSLLSFGTKLITIWVIVLTFWFFVPPKETLYYMAASEVGEKVVTDPQAIEILSDLKMIIKGYAKEVGIK